MGRNAAPVRNRPGRRRYPLRLGRAGWLGVSARAAGCSVHEPGFARYTFWPPGLSPQAVQAAPARGRDPVVGAAGDIACDRNNNTPTTSACQQAATSDVLVAARPTAVLTLGDEQYVEGRLKNFQTVYAPTWGRLLAITHPAPGNHEYKSANADGYYTYFGKAAGDPKKPYYSFDLGTWHIIALNRECSFSGGCGRGSPQERWLVADLAAHSNRCTLAFWHLHRFRTRDMPLKSQPLG